MLRKPFFSGLALVALGILASCQHEAVAPTPCYAGRVVAITCSDGVLIDVDTAYAIGSPAYLRRPEGDTLVGRNVIATFTNLGGLDRLGQRLYFATVAAPTSPPFCPPNCLVFDGVRDGVERLWLENVSTVACGTVGHGPH